jgi:hypothetical protein
VVKHHIMEMNERMKVNLCTILCLILDEGGQLHILAA